MQNNVRAHTIRAAPLAVSDTHIWVLPTHIESPDLDPTENLCDQLKRRVMNGEQAVYNQQQLINTVKSLGRNPAENMITTLDREHAFQVSGVRS